MKEISAETVDCEGGSRSKKGLIIVKQKKPLQKQTTYNLKR